MSGCLSFDTVVDISALQLHTLSNVGNELDAKEDQSRAIFSLLVGALNETLRRTYQAAAKAAGDADDPLEAAAIWEKLGGFTDNILTVLSSLKDLYPFCGTPELYDLALDYKSAAQRRADDDREEALCLSENWIPAGLFPATK